MHTFISLLIVFFTVFAAYAMLRMWHEYGLGVLLQAWLNGEMIWHIRRIGTSDEWTNHSCFKKVKTLRELYRLSIGNGRQTTLANFNYDYELRACKRCGSIIVARKIPKLSSCDLSKK